MTLLCSSVAWPQGLSVPRKTLPKNQAAELNLALRAAEDALTAKETTAFLQHIAHARAIAPYGNEALTLLLQAAGEDTDARLLAALDIARAQVPTKGRFKPSKDLKTIWPEDDSVAELAQARAQAAQALSKFADSLRKKKYKKSMASPIEARWLLSIARITRFITAAGS